MRARLRFSTTFLARGTALVKKKKARRHRDVTVVAEQALNRRAKLDGIWLTVWLCCDNDMLDWPSYRLSWLTELKI